ncbi:hypothetical protein QO034_05665 [Sedimentitalea sp. JM2-8]|uniref:HlyD family secretion protein n=1 Tax=Sedimentitalea xiamensis TaxID=3050037 RepID=A0ABT7FCB6_9RHOB|nr:hypothetical protein [Sedimentitalea xiamensis]MDK3072590.1 hypothetical protein [Sedimentitalea xiamensis]
MKLFSVSVGLLLAALAIFYVPVSFSVDGFGLVVNPGGVRTIRAADAGVVQHFPSEGGRFRPGQIVTTVTDRSAVAENASLLGTMQRELAKIESDHLESTSKLHVDLERDRAKRMATAERLAARTRLQQETADVLAALQDFNADSESDIVALNAERLSQLARLEELVKRSGEVSALPAQKLATTLEDIQDQRLSVITSRSTRFSSDKMVLDMVKTLNDLTYDNSIDTAEVDILTERLDNLTMQMRELEVLRQTTRDEAEARYLAKTVLPQVAVSDGFSVDMRTMQASRADVAKDDALRLLASGKPMAGLSILIYGAVETGSVVLRSAGEDVTLALPPDPDALRSALSAQGLEIGEIHIDEQMAGSMDIVSVFVEFLSPPQDRLIVLSTSARSPEDLPVLVTAGLALASGQPVAEPEPETHEIVGFLENRHAVVLRPGQAVRGSISDTRTGSEIVFDAQLLDRDFSTVDTKELGIRLGNASLADKIIKRGVLSQVVVGVSPSSADRIEHLPGAVVHLTFPLARQSLFSFLLARNDSI